MMMMMMMFSFGSFGSRNIEKNGNKVKCVLYLSWLDGANRIHTNRIRKVPQTKVELWLSEEDGRMRQKDWIGGKTRALDPCMFLSISPSSS